ncbi:unnamed protein product [Linum trigynum]|uniref:Uncharacterized protein n=1 Tax=Linum trigynum TaxID=586398 RepID=A0AAV2E6P5_9ROSI
MAVRRSYPLVSIRKREMEAASGAALARIRRSLQFEETLGPWYFLAEDDLWRPKSLLIGAQKWKKSFLFIYS